MFCGDAKLSSCSLLPDKKTESMGQSGIRCTPMSSDVSTRSRSTDLLGTVSSSSFEVVTVGLMSIH